MYDEQRSIRRAAILDPRFKVAWCTDQSDADAEKKALIIDVHRRSPHVESPSISVSSTADPPTKRCKLFGFMNQNHSAPCTKNSETADKIDTYLSQACLPKSADPTEFWHTRSGTFPLSTQLARKYLTVPATSAPVKRLFSVTGKVFHPDRIRLTDTQFQRLMFIKCNKAFYLNI